MAWQWGRVPRKEEKEVIPALHGLFPFRSICVILKKKEMKRYDVRTQYTDPRGGRLYAAQPKVTWKGEM